MSIWEKVSATSFITNNELNAWRIVEDQSKSMTRKFVDTLDEHACLESLIDHSKPLIKYQGDHAYFKGLHYLLGTPFRYPPLRWGSRFGSRFERALLYASIELETAMSEKAFYKLAFLKASEGSLGGKTITYTAFRIRINGEKFVNLSDVPFRQFKNDISSKMSYDFSQALGKEMRGNHVEFFQYVSARCENEGHNIGVLTPRSLQKNPALESTFNHLNCFFTKDIVEFSTKSLNNLKSQSKHVFPVEMFRVNGILPLPPA